MMTHGQVRAKARMARNRHEEELAEEDVGEINLVPYLDIVTNVTLFMLATITSGFLMGNINSALPEYADSAGAVNDKPTDKEQKEPSLQMVVSVTKPAILVWSISGLEGTLEAPKMRIDAKPGKEGLEYDFDKLSNGLKGIVEAR